MENLIGKCYKYSYGHYCIINETKAIWVTQNISLIEWDESFSNLIEISLNEFKEVLNERLEFFRTLEPKKEKYFTPEQVERIMEAYASCAGSGSLQAKLERLEK